LNAAPTVLHATAIAHWRAGSWRAVLLRGPSGAGKSDLALRLLGAGWRLVADDRVIAWSSGGRLYARAPARLAGLIEARGLGVAPVGALDWAQAILAVDLVAGPEALERIPEPARTRIEGVDLPLVGLVAHEDSAMAKLLLALEAATLGARQEPAYQVRSADEA
jgi:serine kinase of HPr protein (carbohydrate metabolism regulator)